MGIHGIYKEIGPGRRVALSKLAMEKFEETGRPLRIAIDTSIWLFQIQASKGGTNPALRTFYYRLLRLIALSIHPVFVFDGPNKPPFKRNKHTGPNVASIPEFLAKQLLKQFGYPIHLAPGEAEAECALLQREGIVDAVLSEDVDTLMFGSGVTIRNWSPEKSGNTPTHVNVYDAVETKNGPSALDREGMILVALMSGGDYVPEGIPGCGPKTACEAAKAGFGRDLCAINTSDKRAMREWRERLQHELKTNEGKLFKRKHGTLKIPDTFPRLDILGYYTHPAVSNQAGLDKLRRSIDWDQALDFPGLRDFTRDAFDWVKLEGAKHFIRSLAPSLLVRQLRMRSKEIDGLPTSNVQAIQEDEALLVKGLHGKRQHPVTDNCTELRVSFIPIELVTINLDHEEPDDEPDTQPPNAQHPDADLEDEVAMDMEDDGPKKRAPTKFDPLKPARIWVLESMVKVGVPLAVQDWEAGRQSKQKPRRAATVQEPATTAPKASKAKRTKTTGGMTQAPIDRFAKVTKPGVSLSRALAKTQEPPPDLPVSSLPPVSGSAVEPIDLLSSPASVPRSTVPGPRAAPEKSPTPVLQDLPPSVTKRRRKQPMQRSQTLPASIGTIFGRPTTPPLPSAIETLDLLISPTQPSPSQLPAKKTKTRITNAPTSRTQRGNSVASSPGKARQTTLDTWTSATPTKLRTVELDPELRQIPAPRALRPPQRAIDELDLTLSSPMQPLPTAPRQGSLANPRRTTSSGASRPPLNSISSNASALSTSSTSSTSSKSKSSKTTTITTRDRRTSPRLRRTQSATPEVDSLDLTSSQPLPARTPSPVPDTIDLSCLSSPAPTSIPRPEHHPIAPASPPPTQFPASASPLRRSPRNHPSLSPEPASGVSQPAAWKEREKRKRQIVLRKSVAGAWDFADVESPRPGGDGVLKGKERRKWRESEVEVLDLS